jgi:hypothetical protein
LTSLTELEYDNRESGATRLLFALAIFKSSKFVIQGEKRGALLRLKEA